MIQNDPYKILLDHMLKNCDTFLQSLYSKDITVGPKTTAFASLCEHWTSSTECLNCPFTSNHNLMRYTCIMHIADQSVREFKRTLLKVRDDLYAHHYDVTFTDPLSGWTIFLKQNCLESEANKLINHLQNLDIDIEIHKSPHL